MDAQGLVEIKDFDTEPEEGHPFRFRGQTFMTIPGIGLGSLGELAKVQADLSKALVGTNGQLDLEALQVALPAAFALFLEEDSAKRFGALLLDRKRPVPIAKIMEIINWFLEVFGLRPPMPSGTSSDTSAGGDSTSSTAGQPDTEPAAGPANPPGER